MIDNILKYAINRRVLRPSAVTNVNSLQIEIGAYRTYTQVLTRFLQQAARKL